jgi:hypothetical protein
LIVIAPLLFASLSAHSTVFSLLLVDVISAFTSVPTLIE